LILQTIATLSADRQERKQEAALQTEARLTGSMTAFAAWQRRNRMWARVQIGCAVVAIVSATLLLCW
jgi:hypothetical protein